jgi:hypothetical protein
MAMPDATLFDMRDGEIRAREKQAALDIVWLGGSTVELVSTASPAKPVVDHIRCLATKRMTRLDD